MQTKLTLRLDDELIEDAKAYAAQHGRSLSQLVADYFGALAHRQGQPPDRHRPSPLTDSLVGLLKNETASADDAYLAHLRSKHLHGDIR